MSQYLYKTILYKDTSSVIGTPASNLGDVSDFEDNHKNSAELVTEILIEETTVVTELSYSDFKNLIVLWSSVKYTNGSRYVLHIISDMPL